MGAGASTTKGKKGGGGGGAARRGSWSDVPVSMPDLQVDGLVEHRVNEEARKNSMNVKTDFGRITRTSQPVRSPEALEAQAAAHWHRIMTHTRDQMRGGGGPPKCSTCVPDLRNMFNCGICGRAMDESEGDGKQAEETTSVGGVPRVGWNPSTKTYDRTLLITAPMDSPSAVSGRKKSVVNDGFVDEEQEMLEMQQLIGTLIATQELKRNKGRNPDGTIKKSPPKLMLPEGVSDSDLSSSMGGGGGGGGSSKTHSPLSILRGGRINESTKREYQKKMNKFMDSDQEDNEEEVLEYAGEDEKSLDFMRRKNRKLGSKEEEEEDRYPAGPPPEPALPPIQIELQRRTGTTISLLWDSSSDMMGMLQAVRMVYGKNKFPVYELQYKQHQQQGSGLGGMEGDSFKLSNSINNKKKEGDDGWLIGSKRTKDCGATVENLLHNTPYAFRCRRVGWSDWEGPPVVIRSGPGPPGPPKQLVAKEVSASSILMTWQVPDKDNGLPVTEYVVKMKPYAGDFSIVFRGRERCFLATNLSPNLVHIFEIQAGNKQGLGEDSERVAIRTLAQGAAPMTPWVEAIDEKTHRVYYCHSKTNAVAWTLPKGAIIDNVGSFRSKRAYLRRQVEKRMQETCVSMGILNTVTHIEVNRGNLLEESLHKLYSTPKEDLDAGPIRVRFTGEEGLDAGGLAKDWFNEVAKRLYDDSTGLLHLSDDTGFVSIDQRQAAIHKPSESRWLFKAIGIFFAKTIIDSHTLGIAIDPLLLMLLCDKEPTLEDLKSSETDFYKGLNWVMENDVTDADLSFTCSYELFDESKVVELVDYGISEAVTEENKLEYVDLMLKWLVRGRHEPALLSFLAGFHQHMPPILLSNFRIDELQLLIGGQPELDVTEIMRDINLVGGFQAEDPQIAWLKEALEEFDHETLSKFLAFLTGCPCLPVDGLVPVFTLTLDEEGTDSMLPRAHTCFNQLVIPAYSSFDVLKERIVYALENTSEGFHMS